MQHLVGSGTPVLYIGRTVLEGYWVKEGMEKLFYLDPNPLSASLTTGQQAMLDL
jgi:hypothetical protein